MNADDLFDILRSSLADDWASDERFSSAWTEYNEARITALGFAGREQEKLRTRFDPETERVLKDAMARPDWPSNAGDVRIALLWDALAHKLTQLGAPATGATVRALRTRRMEASTLPTDDGCLIVLDLSLHDLVSFHLQMILASTAFPQRMFGGESVDHGLLDRETAVRAGRATNAALKWTGDVGVAFGIVISQPIADFEQDVLELAEQFVMAHEYAHQKLGHLQNSAAGSESQLNFGPVAATVFMPNWNPEFEADQFAAALLLFGTNARGTVAALIAILVTLNVMDLATSNRYVIHPPTHPDAAQRYSNIIAYSFENIAHPIVKTVSKVVGNYFEDVAYPVETPDFLNDPLEARLLKVPQVFSPAGMPLSAMNSWEFRGHVMGEPAHMNLVRWGDRCFAELGVQIVRGAALLAYDTADQWDEMDTSVWISVKMAFGQAWFEHAVLPKITSDVIARIGIDGTTFSQLRQALEDCFGNDWLFVSETIPMLALWRRGPSASSDLVHPFLLDRARELLKMHDRL